MKTHNLRLHLEPFLKIHSGEKIVEVRLNDEKRQQIEVGDEINFSLRTNESVSVTKGVAELMYFNNFEELYLVYPEERVYNASQYYSSSDVERFGLIVLALK